MEIEREIFIDSFEIETFKMLANFLQDDLKETLKSMEPKRFKSESSDFSQQLETLELLLKKIKHDKNDVDEQSVVKLVRFKIPHSFPYFKSKYSSI